MYFVFIEGQGYNFGLIGRVLPCSVYFKVGVTVFFFACRGNSSDFSQRRYGVCLYYNRVFIKNPSSRRKVKCYRRIFWERLEVCMKNSHKLPNINRRILHSKWRILRSLMCNETPCCKQCYITHLLYWDTLKRGIFTSVSLSLPYA